MNGADPRAAKHRDRRFRNHRQVNRHPVTFLHAEAAQHVGELADLREELPIGECALIARFAFEDDRRLVASRRTHMAIEAVRRHVQLAVAKPGGEWRIPLEPLGERADPFQFLRLAHPVRIGISGGGTCHRFVLHICGALKRRRRRKAAIFSQQCVELGHVAMAGQGRDTQTSREFASPRSEGQPRPP